jgi:hypothetical protein
MASFVAVGHPYTLYSYAPVRGLPDGVMNADAVEVISKRKVAYLLERRAFAMVANLFRYVRLLDGGFWVDTDTIALRQFQFAESALVFGWEDTDFLANGVLGAPAGHRLIVELQRLATSLRSSYAIAERTHHNGGRLRRARGIVRYGRTFSHAEVPWGTFGPRLLTRVAHERGLAALGLAPAAFYPIHYNDIDLLLGTGPEGEALISPDSFAVHVWNSVLQRRGITVPPSGSLLARLVAGEPLAISTAR